MKPIKHPLIIIALLLSGVQTLWAADSASDEEVLKLREQVEALRLELQQYQKPLTTEAAPPESDIERDADAVDPFHTTTLPLTQLLRL